MGRASRTRSGSRSIITPRHRPHSEAGGPLGLLVLALAGLLVFLLLHFLFVLRWEAWFAVSPWPDYADVTARGLVEPWFVHTPRSLWLTRAALFALAAAVALGRRSAHIPAAFALWVGSATGAVFAYATTSLPTLPSGAIGYVLYPLRLLLPILLGTVLGAIARKRLRHEPA